MRTKHVSEGDPDYRRAPKSDYYCMNCQRDIVRHHPHRRCYVIHISGEDYLLHPDDVLEHEERPLDFGWLPLGLDCAERFGLEWSVSHGG